jgi:hypothetical protein
MMSVFCSNSCWGKHQGVLLDVEGCEVGADKH